MSGQVQFAAALVDPALPAPEGLGDGAGRPAGRRFDVYRNNVVVGLSEALAEAFPVVAKLVGEEFFAAMAGVFVRAHPPRTPLMMFYGEEFPGFLEDFPPAAGLGYLPDVARLELAVRQSYHAADATPMDPAAVAAMAGEALLSCRLRLAPALRLVSSPWPVLGIWRANMDPGAPPPAAQPEDVLITRPGHDPAMTPMEPGGARFVAELAGGAPIGTAIEAALARAPGFTPTATLSALLSGGAITGLLEDDTA